MMIQASRLDDTIVHASVVRANSLAGDATISSGESVFSRACETATPLCVVPHRIQGKYGRHLIGLPHNRDSFCSLYVPGCRGYSMVSVLT